MASNSDTIIAHKLGVQIGQFGLAPALQKWGPVIVHKDASTLITRPYLEKFGIDLPAVIEGPLLLEFVSGLLKGIQQVHNDYGVSFSTFGFVKEAKTHDGLIANAVYNPTTDNVYIPVDTLAEYQEQRTQEKKGKEVLRGTVNLPGITYPPSQEPLVMGLEEALHSVQNLAPGKLVSHTPFASASLDIGAGSADLSVQHHASRSEEKDIREPMLAYAKKLGIGPYNQGKQKGF